MRMAKYTVKVINDLMVIVFDDDAEGYPSVTNSADAVVNDLNSQVGGLGSRRVYYRDSVGRFDELCHTNGIFASFAACKPSQQEAFREMTKDAQDHQSFTTHFGTRAAELQAAQASAGIRHLRVVTPSDERKT